MQFLDGQNSITLFKGYIQYIFTMFFFSLKENTFESWENVFYVTQKNFSFLGYSNFRIKCLGMK